MNDMVKSTIHAVRMDGFRIDAQAVVDIYHDKGIDEQGLLPAMDKCFSDWYKTPEGKKAWEYTGGDLNIGDMLCGFCPDADFTKKYGFVIDDDSRKMGLIEISYDRVFGNGDKEDDDNEENKEADEE